jgi:hypothetical protein
MHYDVNLVGGPQASTYRLTKFCVSRELLIVKPCAIGVPLLTFCRALCGTVRHLGADCCGAQSADNIN